MVFYSPPKDALKSCYFQQFITTVVCQTHVRSLKFYVLHFKTEKQIAKRLLVYFILVLISSYTFLSSFSLNYVMRLTIDVARWDLSVAPDFCLIFSQKILKIALSENGFQFKKHNRCFFITRPITTRADNPMNQSDFETKKYRVRRAGKCT